MRVAVVTVGARKESLGAMKLARWLSRSGHDVDELTDVGMFDRYDLYAFSAVFSWQLPRLCQMARTAVNVHGGEVWVGGPAVTFHPANAAYVERETGVRPTTGIDQRWEREPGDYPMTYFSRGCPAYTPACGLCPVPRLEGNDFTLYPDASPAPLLLDNNLSALPGDYQDHVIRRYERDWRGGLVDANSGFEPHTFTRETMRRWEAFPLRYWRFGYDDLSERTQALAMLQLLRENGHTGEKVRVYTLFGNEPIADCLQRAQEVIAGGGHPWPQRLRPLDWLGGPLPVRHDWDEDTLIAAQRFYSIRGLWARMKPEDFHYQGRYPLRFGQPRRYSLPTRN